MTDAQNNNPEKKNPQSGSQRTAPTLHTPSPSSATQKVCISRPHQPWFSALCGQNQRTKRSVTGASTMRSSRMKKTEAGVGQIYVFRHIPDSATRMDVNKKEGMNPVVSHREVFLPYLSCLLLMRMQPATTSATIRTPHSQRDGPSDGSANGLVMSGRGTSGTTSAKSA